MSVSAQYYDGESARVQNVDVNDDGPGFSESAKASFGQKRPTRILRDAEKQAFAKMSKEALKKAGVSYQLFMYDGSQHAFHNDTAPTRYNEAAAKLAWSRSIEFLKVKLK